MRRYGIIIVWIGILVLMVSGCADITISMGVNEKNEAFLSYRIQADLSEMGEEDRTLFQRGMGAICTHYESTLGFLRTDRRTEENQLDILLTKSIPADSAVEAFSAFRGLMMDARTTPFLEAGAESNGEEYEKAFVFWGQTDLGKILSTARLDKMPLDIRNRIEQGIAETTGRIELTLPATTVVSSIGDSVEQQGTSATVRTALVFREQIVVVLMTRLTTKNDGTPSENTIEKEVQNLSMNIRVVGVLRVIAVVLAIAAIAVVFVVYRNKRKKRSEETKEDESTEGSPETDTPKEEPSEEKHADTPSP